MDKNKRICELLNIHWHEELIRWNVGNDKTYILRIGCTCKRGGFDKRGFTNHCKKNNPDLTTPSGTIQLLEIMRKRDDWKEFIWRLGFSYYTQSLCSQFIEDYFIDTITGKFRDAAIEFLESQNKT